MKGNWCRKLLGICMPTHGLIVLNLSSTLLAPLSSSSSGRSMSSITRTAMSLEEALEQMTLDRAWAQSPAGKDAIRKSIEFLRSFHPHEHVLANCMHTYLRMRGLMIESPSSSETKAQSDLIENMSGAKRVERNLEEIAQEIQRVMTSLHQNLKTQTMDISALQNLECQLESLEKEKESAEGRNRVIEAAQLRTALSFTSAEARTLSSLCTFPLSLAYGIRKIFGAPITDLSVLVVGALHKIVLIFYGIH